MKKKFTFMMAALMLLTMIVQPGRAWGQTRTEILNEPFNISGTDAVSSTYNGWAITRCWGGNGSIRLGASSGDKGQIISPALTTLSGDATMTFEVKKYGSDTGSIGISISAGNGSVSGDVSVASSSISADSWTTKTVTITGGSSTTKIKFLMSNKRMYLRNVVIVSSGGGTDPSISAYDVNIAYDATEGGIAYTINNPVEGGALSAEVTDGDWLSLGQGTASPIAFTCSANEASVARTATVRLTYTYNAKAIVTKDVTITQAAAPVIYTTIPQLFAAATSTETNVNVTFGDWVVSGVSSSSAYVTDNSGNGFIIYKSGHGFAVNNKLSGTVTGTPLKLYQGSAELTNLTASTTGLTVNDDGEITIITNKTITDLGGVNTGAVITLSNLTYDGTNLSDGTNTIKPYNTLYSGMSFTNGKIYNVTGVYVQFGNTKEIAPRSAADIVEVTTPTLTTTNVNITSNATEGAITYTLENPTQDGVLTAEITAGNEGSWLTLGDLGANVPFTCTANTGDERTAIVTLTYTYNTNETVTAASVVTQAAYAASVTVDPATVNAPYSGADGTLNVTYNNITDINAEVWFCNAEGTAAASYDWITADINADNDVEYLVEENNGDDARTAYLKVWAYDDDMNEVYSNLVTINQAKYVVDYAILPFEWEGGASNDFIALTGVSANGLGGDYAAGNAPYLIKFDNTDDYIQVKTDSQPAQVTIGVKMIGGSSISKITVKASADGTTFDYGEELTISGSQNDVLSLQTTRDFGTNVRFVRMVFTKGSNVGVGPITITKYTTDPIINAEDVNITCDATNGSIAYTISNPVAGGVLTADIIAGDWLTLGGVTTSVPFTCTANTTDADRTATVRLTYTYNTSETVTKDVTITQSKVDYATMPFEFVGNEAIPTGVSTDAGTYSSSPYLKFDATGKYLVLKLNEAPVSISYDIKGNSFSGGTFTVQVSANGSSYTDIETYTSLGDTQTITLLNSVDNVRYIKWVYTEKASGNVALGNINVTTDMIINGDCTVNDFTISNTDVLTIEAGSVMTVTGTLTNTNPDNLIIEDGGQLITTSAGVKATFKKTTTASTEAKDATNNWYAISSPVNEIAISTFAAGTHNVYSYIEKSHYWNEYRGVEDPTLGTAPFDNLENGRGYLYRSTASGIDFKGDVNIDDATYSLTYTPAAGNLAGFHLIGNPYTHNIYKGANAAINSEYLTDGLYTLNVNGGWEAGTDNTTVIAPGCAVLVQTTEAGEGQTLTITNTDHQGPQAKYANDQIMFTVENTEYTDNTYVLFKKGQGLNKIEHRNAEIPMLYVISEGENYAIADMPDNTDVINLGFEAKTMGQYTISLKAEGQYSYMHLVDKLTGNDIDMLVEDSYTFVGTPNDRNDRFVLRLNYNAAGIDTESDIFAYQSGNDIMVSGEGELQVFDITGRKVMTTDINGVETINGMNRGVYIFRLNEKTQKIVVR